MKLSIPLFESFSLHMADHAAGDGEYPTHRLQKGLLLLRDDKKLGEEGVGFGVPILKRGTTTIFPGGVELTERRSGPICEVTAAFAMNLVERLARPGAASVKSRSLYAAKNSLAALHRRAPALRGPLTATSNALRRTFGWETVYEEVGTSTTLQVTYGIRGEEGGVTIALDLADLAGDDVTEVVVMNEQGARHFDRYADSDGTTLQGNEIGTWEEVAAARATFVSAACGVAFSLGQVDGARLHRGRELIGSRVAWSGFGYSLPPTMARFTYDLGIERVR